MDTHGTVIMAANILLVLLINEVIWLFTWLNVQWLTKQLIPGIVDTIIVDLLVCSIHLHLTASVIFKNMTDAFR